MKFCNGGKLRGDMWTVSGKVYIVPLIGLG